MVQSGRVTSFVRVFGPSSSVFSISRMYPVIDMPGSLPTHRGGLKDHHPSQPAQMSGANELQYTTIRQVRLLRSCLRVAASLPNHMHGKLAASLEWRIMLVQALYSQ